MENQSKARLKVRWLEDRSIMIAIATVLTEYT